ncbi:hypothetical protein G7078_08395 [Sphingomonas sinipercae]|uniref:DUF2178 domain-containing protein n=1 Tax=Sphingomonas sinipercae TaxID=2714944 RepID=A0A6G7ZPD9_9SPHN|nr:hypothetical protein [Sphingomonas sinipercae]QIL02798.1 hypothetical protein G7078_08395 [Sphingomonas sinipercae]
MTRVKPMVEDKMGVGERREAMTRRKQVGIIAALAVPGFLAGVFIGRGEAKALLDGADVWSPELAIATTIVYLVAIIGASILLHKTMDEVQTQTQYKASAFAGTAFMVVYPVWFLLWKGGFVIEPIHWVIYILFVFTSLAASAYYRFR